MGGGGYVYLSVRCRCLLLRLQLTYPVPLKLSYFCFYDYSGYLKTSETHANWGEAFGVVCWLWVFYRARKDLPVVLGWRHPWDHDSGSHDDHHHDEHDAH
jgi:hypothetical protein